MRGIFKKQVKDYVLITVGTAVMSVGLNAFLIPNKIVSGGVSGLGTILYHLTGVGVGLWMLIINIPLFIAGFKTLGKGTMVKTAAATVVLSVLTDALSQVFSYKFDPVISSVYGGASFGIGIGLVFMTSATTGGSDLLSKQLERLFPRLSPGQVLLLVDTAVILLSAAIFKDYSSALYGFLSLYISSIIIDMVTGGFNFSKAVYIISDYGEGIKQEIIETLNRGATKLSGVGAYTGEEKSVILCVISRAEVVRLKLLVKRLDPRAFVIITDAKEVMGEGFGQYTKGETT